MKRLILAAALALCACTPAAPPASAGNVAPVATVDRVVLVGARSFAVAELWYTTGAQLVGQQVDRGRITGPTATRIRTLNAEARQLLIDGKAAVDAAGKARAAARLFAIGDLFRNLGGK